MQLIKELEELIEDETHDVKKYAKLAAKLKHDHPALSHVLYTISTQEENHQNMLHEQVVKLIEQYRREHGTPPPEMQAVYNYLHERAVEKLEEAHRYQEIYKSA